MLLYASQDYQRDLIQVEKDESLYSKSIVFKNTEFVNLSRDRFEIPEKMIRDTFDVLSTCNNSYTFLVSGGLSKLTGFVERLESNLKQENPRVQIVTSNDPLTAVWQGAKLLSMTSFFEQESVRKADYDEFGIDAISQLF